MAETDLKDHMIEIFKAVLEIERRLTEKMTQIEMHINALEMYIRDPPHMTPQLRYYYRNKAKKNHNLKKGIISLGRSRARCRNLMRQDRQSGL